MIKKISFFCLFVAQISVSQSINEFNSGSLNVSSYNSPGKNWDINTYKLHPVSNKNIDLDVIFYPNPIETVLNVEIISTSSNSFIEYQIFDIKGALMKSESMPDKSFMIDMSNYSHGTYLLNIGNATEKKTYKLIKK